MPEGESTYYTNSVDHPHDRFEDYIVTDLISDVETKVPADPSRRAIAGVSMGGFGAIKLALKHPGLYKFVGALSPGQSTFPADRSQSSRFHSIDITQPFLGRGDPKAAKRMIHSSWLGFPIPEEYLYSLRGTGRPIPVEPPLRSTPRPAKVSVRVSRRDRRTRLEPMEPTTSLRI